MPPSDCKKYETCNASICPLDENWRKCSLLSGDCTCRLLMKLSKSGGLEHLTQSLPPEQVSQIAAVHAEILDHGFPGIFRRLTTVNTRVFPRH